MHVLMLKLDIKASIHGRRDVIDVVVGLRVKYAVVKSR